MDTKVDTLESSNTNNTQLPSKRDEIKGCWVYAIKSSNIPGKGQYKPSYVDRGYSQVQGIDYDETYSPTTRFTSIRTLLQKAVNDDMYTHQIDVKGANLNAPIDKDISVQQPPGYELTGEQGTYQWTQRVVETGMLP